MSEQFPRMTFVSGERIFLEGAPGDAAYIVEEGKVSITKAAGAKEAVLATVGPGAIIGEYALIDNAPRMATATAVTACTLLAIDATQFQKRIAVADPLIRKLLHILVENIRSVTDRHVASVTA